MPTPRQVVVLGGGSVFSSYKAYLLNLRTREVDINTFMRNERWKTKLPETLGASYEVFQLIMPNRSNAVFEEWSIWFERLIPYLKDNVLFIAHSLGAIFLVKYLSQNDFPRTIHATFLVSTPFDDHMDVKDEILGTFQLPTSIENFVKQAGVLHMYHSTDDTSVPYNHIEKYHALIPNATIHTFTDRNHFSQDTFPEIIEDIQKA